ncbi:ThrRS/AlaRS common domain-containing protein [Teratosphaeria nubilosa]|uniref:ThrRS/AlaRS common domain-containing protein n=1 Tax=Teratosphaeria nubilosa TaxID=161662 RepID=A0A6G1KZL9_9PEZI|nr:ThrRS/AlaRS common domain-containing protein [Teratosphaeria nubilosa]
MSVSSRTYLAFQHNAKLHTLSAIFKAVLPASQLQEANKAVFKQLDDNDHVVVTDQTIFHPQGGGQPSDVGTMKTNSSTFNVTAVRMDAISSGQVLHLGTFQPNDSPFKESETVEQAIDAERRLLYSRLHTAGHVLGAATRKLLEHTVPGFDELKASHFPDMASCEFAGSIAGTHKDAIQAQVDEFIDADLPVEIDFWSEQDFKDRGLERLIVGNGNVAPGEKFRVVRIVGADTYPCGGTHVESTRGCGKTTVKKISRNKGTSRVSYTVD